MTVSDEVRAINQAVALGETIRELGRVPNGHLWSRVQGYMTFNTYTKIIQVLKLGKLIEESNNELIWIGPETK
jgi:hypothetical protein